MESDRLAALQQYAGDQFAADDPLLAEVRRRSIKQGFPQIHITAQEGLHLHFLLRCIKAERVIEIGTLAGYSAIWMARALPPQGHLITLEQNEEHAALARSMVELGGLSDRIEIRTGRALDTLPDLADGAPYDAVFIDADKRAMLDYLAWAVEHVRVGGLILAHNAFMRGRVLDPPVQADGPVQAMRAYTRALAEHPRLLALIIPVGDGISAALRV